MKKIKICISPTEMKDMTTKAEDKNKFIFYYGPGKTQQEIWARRSNNSNFLKEYWYGSTND